MEVIYAVLDCDVSSGNRSSRRESFPSLLLGQEPFGKIYPLGQFRYLPPHFLNGGAQFLGIPHLAFVLRPLSQTLGVRLAHRRQRDHPGKKPADGDDRNEDGDHPWIHRSAPSRFDPGGIALGQEALGEIDALGQLGQLLAHRAHLVDQVCTGVRRDLGLVTDAVGQRTDQRTQQNGADPDHGEHDEEPLVHWLPALPDARQIALLCKQSFGEVETFRQLIDILAQL
ncbi:MAG TPA: hypothetical protein VFP39_13875, partial [Gemmatimonadales bacterium]|nr:hypothetical protein [Gemmatimonadales bacterium]